MLGLQSVFSLHPSSAEQQEENCENLNIFYPLFECTKDQIMLITDGEVDYNKYEAYLRRNLARHSVSRDDDVSKHLSIIHRRLPFGPRDANFIFLWEFPRCHPDVALMLKIIQFLTCCGTVGRERKKHRRDPSLFWLFSSLSRKIILWFPN